MSVSYAVIFCLIQSAALSSSCSVNEFDTAADNAFITCMTNVSCEAGCYRGYIFPNGQTNESYICQDGFWTPVILTCKPIPEVSVKYAVTWFFSEVVPYQCGNITAKFNDSKEILEKTFASVCKTINKTISFTYSTLAFTITATFTAKYNNFSNWNALEKCKTLTIISFKKLLVIKTIFDDVSCGDSHLNRTILKEFRIEDSHEQCSNGMEIHNVTRSSGGTFGVYCDCIVPEMTEEVNTTSSLSILKCTTSVTETTKFNTTTKVGLSLRSSIYILVPAAGFDLISGIVTLVLRRRKRAQAQEREKSYETIIREEQSHTYINMADITNHYDVIGYGGIYILVPAADVCLISGIVILEVRRRKRDRAQEREELYETIIADGQTQYVNITDNAHHYGVIAYRK